MNISFFNGKNAFFIIVIVLAGILLSLHLGEDCDPSVSYSAGIDFDGPSKTHNARNLVLYGEWLTDDWTPFVHSPLHTLLLVPFFRLMGVGLIQMRMYTVLFSCLALWMLYLVIRREQGSAIATIVAFLCAVNVDFIMYGRSGLLEPAVLFFMMMSVWLFQKGYKAADKGDSQVRTYIWFALAAIGAFAAILYKMVAIPFVLAMILALILFPPKKRLSIAVFISAFLILLSLYLFVFIPHFEQFYDRESGYWLERAGNLNLFKAWLTQPLYYNLPYAVLITSIGTLACCWAFRDAWRSRERSKSIATAVMAATFILGSQLIAPAAYRPPRYYMPLFLPAFVLFAAVVSKLASLASVNVQSRLATQARRHARIGIVYWIWCILVLAFVLHLSPYSPIRLLQDSVGWVELKRLQIFLWAMVLAVILCGFWLLFGRVLAGRWWRMRVHYRRWIIAAAGILLLGLYLKPNLESYIDWIEHPKSSMLKFSRMLGDKYKDMKIAGITPHFAVMENRHQALKVTPYHLNWHVVTNKIATHLLIPTDFQHLEWYRKQFPETMENAVYLDSITIGKFHHNFYAIGLESLEWRVEKQDGSISVFNPDAHTPYFGALFQIASGRGVVRCEEMEIAPGAELSLRGAKDASWHWIANTEWRDLEDATIIPHHTKAMSDSNAWQITALKFHAGKRDDLGCFDASLTVFPQEDSDEISLLAFRLKGRLTADSSLVMEWVEDDRVVQTRSIHTDELDGARYKIFCIKLEEPSKNGALRVKYYGENDIVMDDYLMVSEKQLQDCLVEWWSEK